MYSKSNPACGSVRSVLRAARAGAGRSGRSASDSSAPRRSARQGGAPGLRGWSSDDEEVHELVDRRLREALRVHAELENCLLLLHGKAAREVRLEFLDEDRHALFATALVADRVFADHFLQL